MSTCNNGLWSPPPQCIDESSCVQPDDVPNTIYSPSPTGWYENGTKIRVKCNKGYETKNNLLTGTCKDGAWRSMPVCEKSADSCSEPPQLPHAVIINQTHQEVFAVDSEVMYQCEDGYTTEQGESMKSVTCISGNWTEGPTCRSSSSSGSSVSTVPTVPISNCGRHPIVQNAVVVQSDLMSLKYRCYTFYSLEGPEIVKCYSNGMWSDKPTCKVAYCVLNTKGHDVLKDVGRKYIKNGETVEMECQKLKFYWVTTHKAEVQCNDGEIQLGSCCSSTDAVFTNCE
ncbi:complement factor H-like isoform X2 [Betta splendens]|nr:complement factor H-like isoform X2 [Betta splendens]